MRDTSLCASICFTGEDRPQVRVTRHIDVHINIGSHRLSLLLDPVTAVELANQILALPTPDGGAS